MEAHQERNLEDLRTRLAEAEETLEAMRCGAVDAMVVEGPDGPRVYTLKGADEPYRILVERMQEGAVTLSEDGTILFANGSFAGMVRAPLEQVIGGPLARFLPERERLRFAAALDEARAANLRREFALRRSDGGEIPALLSLGLLPPCVDVPAIAMIASDLSEQKQNEEIVAAERFLRSILEQAAEPIIICDPAGKVTHASRAALALCEDGLIGRPLAQALPLAGVGTIGTRACAARLNRKFKKVLGGKILSSFEVSFAGNPGRRHYLLSAGPLHDGRERVVGCMVMLTDITERKRAEEHQQVLLAELSHRVKNTLASVQAIATQTLRGAASLETFGTAFGGRLQALALAHGVLTQTNWSEAELGELIRQSLAPYLASSADRVRLSGPPTYLPPRQVVITMLMMHELAVNAAKYGALSNDQGRVGIEWTVEPHGEQRRLRLHWAESGGPPVGPPARKGFGTTLIERSIGHELDGQATFQYHPQGVTCELCFPLHGSATDLLRDAEAAAGQLKSDLKARTLP